MTKINPENMKKLYDKLWDIFCKKNHDYGDSFEKSLDKHGLVASVVRMEDKMNRLSTLARGDKDAQIASESLLDTFLDLANYAAMSACWLMHEDDEWGDVLTKRISGSIEASASVEDFKNFVEGVLRDNSEVTTDKENPLHLSSFKDHDQKVNERAYYDRDDVTDAEIIKNWGLCGDTLNDIKSVRSRTTGQYLTEEDDPKLFNKICGVLRRHNDKDGKTGRDNVKQPLLTEPKGLENGYFIRQHTNVGKSDRYTLAFNPEGTVKTETGEELPYVIECFGNDYDGMTNWAIHVFASREDMVAALNYDLKVCNEHRSSTFGDSIGSLRIIKGVFKPEDAKPVADAWTEAFGESFDKNMTCKNIFSEGYFGILQGIKTFGPVFISEKTGALIVKGLIRERHTDRNHNFIWFSDTKEVLLELKNTVPKFNNHGIIYGLNSVHILNGEKYNFNPLYQDMEDKILSKFHSWDGSELKNLVFFNEDEVLNSEFTEKKMQIPKYLVAEKPKNTVGSKDLGEFSGVKLGDLSSKNGKIELDLTGGKLYSVGLEQISGEN